MEHHSRKIGENRRKKLDMTQGVPQSSRLGPILWKDLYADWFSTYNKGRKHQYPDK